MDVIFVKAVDIFRCGDHVEMWRGGDAVTRVGLLNDLAVYMSMLSQLRRLVWLDVPDETTTLFSCGINVGASAEYFGISVDTFLEEIDWPWPPSTVVMAADLSRKDAEPFFMQWQRSKTPLASYVEGRMTPSSTMITKHGTVVSALFRLFSDVNFDDNLFASWSPSIQSAVFANLGRALKKRLRKQLKVPTLEELARGAYASHVDDRT